MKTFKRGDFTLLIEGKKLSVMNYFGALVPNNHPEAKKLIAKYKKASKP